MEDASSSRYEYKRFGCNAKRVGQAVTDILSKERDVCTAGQIIDEYGPKYALEIEKSISEGVKKYRFPFYVFVLTKKEQWATNLVRNFFIARQTAPSGLEMMVAYPHHTKTLYRINDDMGGVKLVWSLPGYEECKSIAKTPQIHSPELVKWIVDCFSGAMNDPNYVA